MTTKIAHILTCLSGRFTKTKIYRLSAGFLFVLVLTLEFFVNLSFFRCHQKWQTKFRGVFPPLRKIDHRHSLFRLKPSCTHVNPKNYESKMSLSRLFILRGTVRAQSLLTQLSTKSYSLFYYYNM